MQATIKISSVDAKTRRKIAAVREAIQRAGYQFTSMFNDRFKGGPGTRRLKFMTYGTKTTHSYGLAELATLDASIHAILDDMGVEFESADWLQCVTNHGDKYLAYCVVI